MRPAGLVDLPLFAERPYCRLLPAPPRPGPDSTNRVRSGVGITIARLFVTGLRPAAGPRAPEAA
jgi:hypothetical protein